MTTNRVNITLTTEQSAGLSAAMDALETAMPPLVSLSGTESRKLFKMGDGSEAFVQKTLDALRLYPELVPSSISLEDLDRDQALRETLRPIRARLRQLTELVDGTYKLAGADLMEACSAVYRTLRIHGEGEGLENLLTDIGQRFKRTSTPPTEPADPPQG